MILANYFTDKYLVGMPAKVAQVLEYIKNTDFSGISGPFEIESAGVSGRILDMNLRKLDDSMPESHINFIDVQVWLSGEEGLGYAPKGEKDTILKPEPDHDIYFWATPEREQFLTAKTGDIMVFFPDDLHRPGILTPNSQFARKAVVKVPVDQV